MVTPRRSAPLTVLALIGGLAVLAGCVSGGGATPPQPKWVPRTGGPPNIVFVLTDDLTTNLVPFMPHVVAMEHTGTTFTNYTVTDSLCCPSRASIMTGMYPHDTHVWSNIGPRGGFPVFYQRGEENNTFATALQAVGYRTAMMGKYLNDYSPALSENESAPYVPPGYSEWDVAGKRGYREFNYTLNENHLLHHYGSAPSDYVTTVLDHRAQAFIRSSAYARKPFMLEVATFAPHRPYVPAPADAHAFGGLRAPRTPAFDRLPSNAPLWLAKHPPLTRAQIRHLDNAFQRRVEDVQSIDRMIGNLEQTLRQTGQVRNTVLVFSSDNGYHMGQYHLTPGKLTAFDTDIRVPLVVTGPGIPAAVRNPAVVQNVDLAPTFDALGGAKIPANTDGRSMVPLLHGQHAAKWPTLALVEHHGPDKNPADPDYPELGSGNPPTYDAIRSPTFSYVRYPDGEREYYNLTRDPYELHNLAPFLTRPELRKLNTALAALHNCHGLASCQRAGYRPGLTVFPSLGEKARREPSLMTSPASCHRLTAAACGSRRPGGSSRRSTSDWRRPG